jgi:hypothetical protein
VNDGPPRGHQAVEPLAVLRELTSIAMPGSVVLDGEPVVREGEVHAGNNIPVLVPDRILRLGDQPGEGQEYAQPRLRL